MSRVRVVGRRVLAVAFAVLLPLSLVGFWANSTIYDSQTFSERSVDLLNSPAVRRALAARITEQLARDGNEQAVNYRPAFQLAIEAVIDTDTFRSIFRTAVLRTHEGLIQNPDGGGAAGLDLSDSVSIIVSTMSLPQDAKPGQSPSGSLGNSLSDVTTKLSDYGVWQLDDTSSTVAVFGFLGAIGCAAGAILLADDKRRMIKSLGLVVVGVGGFLFLLVSATGWIVGSRISDPQLASAVQGAIARGMADLSSIGLWTVGYGLVIAAAAHAAKADAQRVTPVTIVGSVADFVDRRRASTRGTIALGALCVLGGFMVVASPSFWLTAAVVLAGMWLIYFGITEVMVLLAHASSAAPLTRRARNRRYVGVGVVAALLIGAFTVAGIALTSRAATRSEAAGKAECNGDTSLCDLPLNYAVFPGTHNSMSTALYPGWLFAEQIDTIGGQLNAGIRALLIDTHYGVPSSARLPGSETPIVLTDRAAELQQPVGEDIDPEIAARAASLAQSAPPQAGASRDIYLCHNFCELGAVKFSSVLGEIKTFVDAHPDEVIMTIIQDATTPADTAAAIEAAGLADRAWTLNPGDPLPTLGQMIDSGKNLLFFAEEGGDGAPAWYQKAYDWFQETRYKWATTDEMTCGPNRGYPSAPLFLVNHWVAKSPPDPGAAKQANSAEELTKRLEDCARERGLVPNIVATDFGETGDVVQVAAELNKTLLGEMQRLKNAARGDLVGSAGSDADAGGLGVSADGVDVSGLFVATQLDGLTGGDPQAFCAAVPSLLDAAAAWSLAGAFAYGTYQGLADLAYAPLAARTIDTIEPAAPTEVAERLVLARTRAADAIDVLRQLGLDDEVMERMADTMRDALDDRVTADPIEARNAVITELESTVPAARLNDAASGFAATNPYPPGIFDFGEVSDAVANNSGYGCLLTVS